MTEEEQPSRGFTVVDKRSSARGAGAGEGAAEESAPSSSVTPEENAPPPSASPSPTNAPPSPSSPSPSSASPANAPSPSPSSARTEEAPPRPPADFSSFIISLASSALYHLGLLPDPQTKKPGEKNLPLARHTIDTLALLQQKTAGNLSEAEAKLLGDLLAEARMRFVEASRG